MLMPDAPELFEPDEDDQCLLTAEADESDEDMTAAPWDFGQDLEEDLSDDEGDE